MVDLCPKQENKSLLYRVRILFCLRIRCGREGRQKNVIVRPPRLSPFFGSWVRPPLLPPKMPSISFRSSSFCLELFAGPDDPQEQFMSATTQLIEAPTVDPTSKNRDGLTALEFAVKTRAEITQKTLNLGRERLQSL